MARYHNKNWSEFDWERKIRSDELHIHNYFREIDNFLDLPDEENMIMEKIIPQPDKVNARADTEQLLFSDVFAEDEDNIFVDGAWRRKRGAELLTELENLAIAFNRIYAGSIQHANMADAMNIICLFGRLLANYADVMAINDNDLPKLKITLCKRLHQDLNKLFGRLQKLRYNERRVAAKIEPILDHLQNIREKIIKIIEKLRAEK